MITDIGEFLDLLKINSPAQYRAICENGGWFNIADSEEIQYRMNNQVAVRNGQLYNSDYQGTLAAGASIFIKQVCLTPLRGVSLNIIYSGSIDYQQVVGATAGNILSTADNNNLDRRILAKSLNVIRILDGFTGGRIVDNGFGISPTSGVNRATSNITGAGVGGIFDSTAEPYFKFTNVGSQTARINLSYIWKEGDI